MVTMRLADAIDLAAVSAMIEDAYGPYVARIGRKPGPMVTDHAPRIAAGQVHLLEQDGRLLGLIVLIARPDALLIENVAVAPGAQGQGLGRQLLDFAADAARRAGLPRLRLYTHVAMVENQRLYARLGWHETHRITEDGLSRIYMEKPLPPS